MLVNGRRLGAGDPSTTNQNVAPDIDQIPVPLIERVDVVTGGASATYGSDAIAGVVNFILKKDFQGIQIDGQYGFNDHDQHNSYVEDLLTHDDPHTGFTAIAPVTGNVRDGYKHDLSMVMGTNFADNNGNITAYFVYHDQQPVSAAARDFSSLRALLQLRLRLDRQVHRRRVLRQRELEPIQPGHHRPLRVTRTRTRWLAINSFPCRRPDRARPGSTITINLNTCSAKTSATRPASWRMTTSTITSSRTWSFSG